MVAKLFGSSTGGDWAGTTRRRTNRRVCAAIHPSDSTGRSRLGQGSHRGARGDFRVSPEGSSTS